MKIVFLAVLLSVSACSIVHYTAETDFPDTEPGAAVLHYRQGNSMVHILRCQAVPLILVQGLHGEQGLQSQDYRDNSGASCILLQQEGQPARLAQFEQGQIYQLEVQCQQRLLPAPDRYTFSPLQRQRQWLWPGRTKPWSPSPCPDNP